MTSAGIVTAGAALVLTLAASLCITVRTSDALARRGDVAVA
ncbi:hypothetical protein [Streptomyces xanthochromogenes]